MGTRHLYWILTGPSFAMKEWNYVQGKATNYCTITNAYNCSMSCLLQGGGREGDLRPYGFIKTRVGQSSLIEASRHAIQDTFFSSACHKNVSHRAGTTEYRRKCLHWFYCTVYSVHNCINLASHTTMYFKYIIDKNTTSLLLVTLK